MNKTFDVAYLVEIERRKRKVKSVVIPRSIKERLMQLRKIAELDPDGEMGKEAATLLSQIEDMLKTQAAINMLNAKKTDKVLEDAGSLQPNKI